MSPTAPHDAFAAMRVRNYRLFALGWFPATLGLQMQATALGWEIYERTGDSLALGAVGLARALPTVLLALPAGQIVDMVDRRKVLVSTQFGFMATSLLLTLGSLLWASGRVGTHAGYWMMMVLVALTGCSRVFNGPSRSSLLPLLIPGGPTSPIFHNAVTWNSGLFQAGATVGPLLAGGLIWLTGHAWPVYLVSALGCIWFGFAAMMLQPDEGSRPIRPPGSALRLASPSILLPGIMEGVRHIVREKAVLGAILLDLFAVLLGGATALMPIYAKDILHVGPVGLGMLKSAPYVGALLMAVVLAHRPPIRRSGPALLWSVAAFGAATIVFGISTSVVLSLVMLATLGAVDNISVVIRSVLVSARTPDRLRGRVAAVNSVCIECSNEVGGFESGLVAKLLGPVFSVVAGGVGTVLVVIGMAMWLPQLRRLGRLDVADAAMPDTAASTEVNAATPSAVDAVAGAPGVPGVPGEARASETAPTA